MSLRADLSSFDAHTLRRGMLALLDRVERLERVSTPRPGAPVGRTEHGDMVYAIAPEPAADDAPRNGVAAAIKTRLGL